MTNIKNYPQHVALIPDGNRTWAKAKWFQQFVWHLEGFNRAKEIATYIFEQTPIKVFTMWWLSTENLKNRSEEELEYLFELYKLIPKDLFQMMKKNHVNFHIAWNMEQLPDHLTDFLINKKNELNFPDSDKYLVLAINYWWQDEILRAMKKIEKNNLEFNQENLEKYMDFGSLPKVELVIRTKQKLAQRLSWFMLWWIWYAQLYFTELFCPEFTVEEFKKALSWYDSTCWTQNYGK